MRTPTLLVGAALLLATALLCATPASAFDFQSVFGLRGARTLRAVSSPPPPPPATTSPALVFPPLCNCDRRPRSSPFRMALDLATSGPETGAQRYCFRVDNVGGCDPRLKCCNGQQGVEKVEFDIVAGCKSSLMKVTVGGVQRSYEYNTKLSVLRVTNLGLTPSSAPGTEVCLFLAAKSACPGLAQLCTAGSGLCKYALFNKDRDCCPVGLLGAAPPPPP
ncbi:Sulfated surface glycoprotein, partial [Tetrabaena socialis]